MSEHRFASAVRVFDVVDRFARDRGARGRRPRPLSPVRFRLLARSIGGQRSNFGPGSTLVVRETEAGYHVFFGRAFVVNPTAAGGPRATLETIPASGTLEVRLESALYAPSLPLRVPIPELHTPYPVLLEPGAAYPFPWASTPPPPGSPDQQAGPPWVHGPTLLRGSVQDSGGAGLAGAEVRAEGLERGAVTDDNGVWVLDFPEEERARALAVTASLSDGRTATLSGIPIQPHTTTTTAPIAIPAP